MTLGAEDFIEIKECLRDLGIQMSDDAKFSNHIACVCSKDSQKCSWILRTINCRKTFFMKFMCKTLVQGHIDYSSQPYFPNQFQELEKIEDLQNQQIPEVNHLDYWKVLEGKVPNCGNQHSK